MATSDIAELHTNLLKTLIASGYTEFDAVHVTPIISPTAKAAVADDPSKSYVADLRGRRVGVLIMSNPVSPGLVARSVGGAHDARQALPHRLASVILAPIVADSYQGLSYAIWPIHRDLSSARVLRHLQRRHVRQKTLVWLRAATQQTLCTEIEVDELQSHYIDPLMHVVQHGRFADDLRHAAEEGLDRLRSLAWQPVGVLQHSDLWLGNCLLPLDKKAKRRSYYGFYIIDWAGTLVSGHPFFDLFKFSVSSRLPTRRLREETRAHCHIVRCEFRDVISYLLAAFGHIGMSLECFPESRYLQMCDNLFRQALRIIGGRS